MSRSKVLPWILLAIWTAWISALQGMAASSVALAPWVPDAVLALLIVLASNLDRSDLTRVALVVALGRLAVSVEPPAVWLGGSLLIVALVRGMRAVVEANDLFARTFLAFAGVLFFARLETLSMEARVLEPARLYAPRLAESLGEWHGVLGPHAWSRAAATALFTLALGPVLSHLPGLTPLRRKRTWHSAASAR